MNKYSSFISHHSSFERKTASFTLIELLVNSVGFKGNMAALQNDER